MRKVVGLMVAVGLVIAGLVFLPSRASWFSPDGGQAAREIKDGFRNLSDSELYERLKEAGNTAAIGLKAPNTQYGVVDGQIVIGKAAWSKAEAKVSSMPGVTVLSNDGKLPMIVARLADLQTLKALRSLPVVDFVEPAAGKVQVHSGCDDTPWGTKNGSRPLTFTPSGDALPWNSVNHKVTEAWKRGAYGQGVKVAVTDTGSYENQWQHRMASQGGHFDTGQSTGRTIEHSETRTDTNSVWAVCSHGTRTVGTVAAPMDGRNTVGAAYKANIASVRIADSVVINFWDTDGPMYGIRKAVEDHHAQIVQMAWGGHNNYDSIRNELYRLYNANDVLFVGAAGTAAGSGWMCGVVYPAKYDIVVAVTGTVEGSDAIHPDACRGPEVDVAIELGEVPAPGRTESEIQHYGGTSAASALVSGIAAQIKSKYPSMNRDQLRDRLYWSTGQGWRDNERGFGRINAYRAVGGFMYVTMNGPAEVAANTSYTVSATPNGEGPFRYQWNTGQTTQSITKTSGGAGTSQSATVTITDLVDGTVKTAGLTTSVAGAEPEPDPDPIDPICLRKPYLCP